jgi:hypothetical protein
MKYDCHRQKLYFVTNRKNFVLQALPQGAIAFFNSNDENATQRTMAPFATYRQNSDLVLGCRAIAQEQTIPRKLHQTHPLPA